MSPAEEEVLVANAAFYEAFAQKDAIAMESLWAEHAPVACIHPGWPPLRGRANVIQSWRSIFSSPSAPPIEQSRASVHLMGEAAFVVCIEQVPGATLVATNIFVREEDEWRMVHHQAGPVPPKAAQGSDDSDQGFLN